MSDKNVDFMRKTDGEEVEGNTLLTQQNKNSSSRSQLKHYELRFVLSSATFGWSDEVSFCCAAESEIDAFVFAESFFSYHKIGFREYLGWRIVSPNYREKFKVGGADDVQA